MLSLASALTTTTHLSVMLQLHLSLLDESDELDDNKSFYDSNFHFDSCFWQMPWQYVIKRLVLLNGHV